MPASPRRNVALATAAYVAGLTTHMTLTYDLAPVALRSVGSPHSDAWLFSGVALAMMVTVVPAGFLADRLPRRHVLAAGLVAQALAAASLALAPGAFPLVLAMAAFSGAGLGLMLVSFNAYVADVLAAAEVAPAYGRTSALAVLGSAVGPFLASFALRGETLPGVRVACLALALASAGGALVALALPRARLPEAPPARAPPGEWRKEARVVAPVMAMYVVLGAGYGMTVPYFTVFFLDRFTDAAWGVLLALGTLASAAGALLLVRLAARRERVVILASQSALALASAVFLFPLAPLALAAAYVARSLAANGVGPLVNAQLARAVRPTARAQAQGYGSLAWNAGWATGAALGATLLATLGGGAFALGGAVGLAGVGVGLALLRAQR